MIFVAIHELAHIMTQSMGHTPEFWNNMKFLLQIATTDLQIYVYQPYHQKPQPYCGIVITDTPLKQGDFVPPVKGTAAQRPFWMLRAPRI
jgi:hypothetical protein